MIYRFDLLVKNDFVGNMPTEIINYIIKNYLNLLIERFYFLCMINREFGENPILYPQL